MLRRRAPVAFGLLGLLVGVGLWLRPAPRANRAGSARASLPAPSLRTAVPPPFAWLGQRGVEGRRIAGRVIHAGQPVPNAAVRLATEELGVGEWTLAETETDDAGRCRSTVGSPGQPAPPGKSDICCKSFVVRVPRPILYGTRMDRIAALGRLFFATSLIAFGVQQFIYSDFIPGRAPEWPAALPGRLIWAYLSGAVFLAAGTAIILGIKARWAAVASGTMIFLWALLRHIPLAAADPSYGLAWTKLGKALALFGGAFAVAGSLPGQTGGFIYLGRVCLGAFLISSGIQHFLFAEFVAQLVPAWIPGALFWTYFAGVALIAGGAGLVFPRTTRWAGILSGLMIFLWLVLLHIPRALAAADANRRNEWTAVFEALAMSGIALVLAGTGSRRTEPSSSWPYPRSPAIPPPGRSSA